MAQRQMCIRDRSENLGGFLDVHAFDHACHENHPERFGKFIDRLLDDILNLTLRHGLFRVGRGRDGEGDDLGVEDFRFQ